MVKKKNELVEVKTAIPEIVIHDHNNVPMASSAEVAMHFKKRHSDVLRAIDNLELEEEFSKRNFAPANYKDSQGKYRRMFWLSRDGFTLAAMGFTGKEALKFKLAYIKAFNLMEVTLKSRPVVDMKRDCDALEYADLMLSKYTNMCKTLNLPEHIGQIESAKIIKERTGVDIMSLVAHSSCQDNIKKEEMMLEPTELADILGMSSAQQVNRWIENLGLQVKDIDGWMYTSKGRPHCIRHAWVKGNKSGYNMKWNVEFLKEQRNALE